MDGLEELPPGWAWATLGEITKPVDSISPAREFTGQATFAYIDLSAIEQHTIRNPQYILPNAAPSRARQKVFAGDTLFSCVRVYLDNIARVTEAFDGGVASSAFAVLRPKDGIDPTYLYWLVRQPAFVSQMASAQRGNSPPAVQDTDVRTAFVPVAPAAEQRRIATEVEALFAELDEAEAALGRAREALTDYRASLLHAACTGRLTESWRAANPQPVEDGPALLGRILAERRAAWERAELARLAAKGKPAPKGDTWKSRYQEPQTPVTDDLSELPNGWIWATVDQLTSAVQYGTSARCSVLEHGIPVIRMGNLQNGRLDMRSLKHLSPDHNEFPELLLSTGDILFNRTNSAELVGKTAVYDGSDMPCSFASYLVRLRTVNVRPHYLANYINSPSGRAWVATSMTQQVGQANVSGGKLKGLVVPVPPRDEQDEILRLVDLALAAMEEGALNVIGSDNESATLRQSILQAAFTGRLVSQDPADEPASALLARLHASPPTARKPRRARSSRKALP